MTKRPDPLPILTRAESELMQLLWTGGPMTVSQVVDTLERKLAYNSVLTLLRILETKGYVSHASVEGSRAFTYAPRTPAQPVQRHHVRDLVARLFGGHPRALMATLLEDEKLSRDDLQALRDELDARLRGDKR